MREEWVANWNGPANLAAGSAGVVLDEAGNVYVAGRSLVSGTDVAYATLKYDPGGNLLWERLYYGPYLRDIAVGIAIDSTGSVYVTGYSTGGGSGYDYLTIKYNTDGDLLWVARYDGPGSNDDKPTRIVVDDEGNAYVTGYSIGIGTDYDYATLKYDTNGNLLWARRYNGPGSNRDEARGIDLDSAGNIYVTGSSDGTTSRTDYATLKYDSNGNLLWTRRYDGLISNYDDAYAIAVDSKGNVYVTGESMSYSGEDYATVKYDTDGNLIWAKRYTSPGIGDDRARAISVDGRGNAYVTGTAFGETGVQEITTLKYDTDGNHAWTRSYSGGAGAGVALAVDSFGSVYITGYSFRSATSYDITTMKYDTSGNAVWEIRYNSPENENSSVGSLSLNNAGDVYVVGVLRKAGSGSDIITIKYSQGTTVPPESFSLFRGIRTGGGLSDLLASDDRWMTVRPGITLSNEERQVQLIVVGTAPSETPSELRFRVEAHADLNNIGQWIDLWNYDTNSYEQVDYMIATTTDSIVEVSISVDPGRFIQAGTKEMKARISYKEAGIVLSFPWLISFDQTVWIIVP